MITRNYDTVRDILFRTIFVQIYRYDLVKHVFKYETYSYINDVFLLTLKYLIIC